jgi:hypothetical protein
MNISALQYWVPACAGMTAGDRIDGVAAPTAVIARFNRATQYSRASMDDSSALKYWVPACAGMTAGDGIDGRRRTNSRHRPIQSGDPVFQGGHG